MSFLNFGKRVKNKRFDYIPRYYDPVKEEFRSRLKANDPNTLDDPELAKMRIRSGLRSKARGNVELKQKLQRSANIRLLVIVGLLVAISYYVLTSNAFNVLVESFLE